MVPNEGTETPLATVCHSKDLTLNLITHQVRRAGKDIALTAREYALLEYLMRHAGQIITRTMLSEHVWNIHFDISTNVIDVYINYLRKKIDHGHRTKLIQTIRGRGYLISAC